MNRLATESSPYLRQHADNPVHWWPWGPDALAEAERRDVPVLLSVGYSACHWCHVMAHESFEDDATAAVMNESFVNVKVDREERPDVDAVYMDAVQAMTGRGGWPMTVFLAPDGRPFYGGTYFPPSARGGLPGFVDLLRAIDDAWRHRRDELLAQADELTAALGRAGSLATSGTVVGPEIVGETVAHLLEHHDDEWGGFGSPPKFPMPHNVDLLVGSLVHSPDDDVRRAVETTLDAMASGGMYDHLGGGFARYSTDRHWVVPHFEKMLYDQAGLLRPYLHAHLVTGHARYRQVVEETVGYVLRDLRLPGGGVASAEDADSPAPDGRSVEGEFSVFTPEQFVEILGEDLGARAIEHWELDREPNFEGRWIPARTHHRGDWRRDEVIDRARDLLREARAARPRPGLDDKVLTEWNAMWIAALAEAGAALDVPDWVAAAKGTATFLLDHLRRDDSRWFRTWQADAGAKHLAFAADLAALVDAFTRLAEASGEVRWLDHALDVATVLIEHHGDDVNGGVFTVADDGDALVVRDKEIQDGAVPAANSVAAMSFLRLAALTGDDGLRTRAEGILGLVGPLARQAPSGFGVLLAAVDLYHRGTTEIVVAGDRPELRRAVTERYLPTAVLAWGERFDSPLWAGREDGAAYVCRQYACGLPATDVATLIHQLEGR